MMPMDEVIRAIEQTDSENLQDVLTAVTSQYRELYPKLKFMILSVDWDASEESSRKILKLMCQLEGFCAD